MKVKNIHSKKHDINYLLSKNLYSIWKSLNLDIGIFRQLKSEHGYDYFDMGKIGYISYLPPKRIDIVKEKEMKFFNNNYRQSKKIGRMINEQIKTQNLESVVNRFKTEQKILDGNFDMLRIVEGEDIKYWYDAKHYSPGGGQLNRSCMRNVNSNRFNIYSKNPRVCKLVILVDERTNLLLGRALLWKTKKHGWYLDRVYTRNDSDMNLYRLFAQSKGYKTFGTYGDDRDMSVQLLYYPSWQGKKNPYMDTFKYFNFVNNSLSTRYGMTKTKFNSL